MLGPLLLKQARRLVSLAVLCAVSSELLTLLFDRAAPGGNNPPTSAITRALPYTHHQALLPFFFHPRARRGMCAVIAAQARGGLQLVHRPTGRVLWRKRRGALPKTLKQWPIVRE